MWIKLPSAALVALITAARGFPWHGAVAGTLGFYLLSAGWALTAHGTRGFLWVVREQSWWAPTAIFAAAAVLTGIPGIRRRLFGARAWSKAQKQAGEFAAVNGPPADGSPPSWSQRLVDSGTSASPSTWSAATKHIIEGQKMMTGAQLLSDGSSLERRNTGPLGRAINTLDECLATVPAVQTGSAKNEAPLSAKQWRQLLTLGPGEEAGAADTQKLTLADRAELVTRAASHSLAAGHVLSWRWLSGLDEAIETLGTQQQQDTLLPLLTPNREIVAAGWTGRSRTPARAVVVSEKRGDEEVLGLRVTCDLVDIVGADSASVIAITVPTFDPGRHMKRAVGAKGSIGVTCLLVRPSGGLALLKGAAMDQRLESHPLTGQLNSTDAFVPMNHVLGGLEGIGAAGELSERCAQTWNTVRVTSLLSGIAQRSMATRGSLTVIRNVMCAETIEAWSHASLGAATSQLNALGRVAALIAEERPIHRTEARALQAAAQRGAQEFMVSASTEGNDAAQESAEEAFLRGLPDVSGAAFDAAIAGAWNADYSWTPTWHQDAQAASQSGSGATFDLARCEGLRRLFQAPAAAVLRAIPGRSIFKKKSDPTQRPTREVQFEQARAALLRAYTTARTAALLEPSRTTAMGAVHGQLELAEERFATTAFLELAHRTEGSQPIEDDVVLLNQLSELAEAHAAVASAIESLPGSIAKAACRTTLRAAKAAANGPSPELAESVAASLVANPEVLRRLLIRSYAGHAENFGTAPLRHAALMASASRVPIAAVQRAQTVGQLPPDEFSTVLDLAVKRRIISSVDTAKIRACMAISQEVLSGPPPQAAQGELRHTG